MSVTGTCPHVWTADDNAERAARGESPVTVGSECGEAYSFDPPADNTDQSIAFEPPCGHINVWGNPNAAPPVSATGDVIWNPQTGEYVPRVADAATASQAVAAGESGTTTQQAS
jgi:hypothetical protein